MFIKPVNTGASTPPRVAKVMVTPSTIAANLGDISMTFVVSAGPKHCKVAVMATMYVMAKFFELHSKPVMRSRRTAEGTNVIKANNLGEMVKYLSSSPAMMHSFNKNEAF